MAQTLKESYRCDCEDDHSEMHGAYTGRWQCLECGGFFCTMCTISKHHENYFIVWCIACETTRRFDEAL